MQLLTACEDAFDARMPHAALTAIRSVEDAASYWEGRLEAEAAARLEEERHWTKVHPPNVRLIEGTSREEAEEALSEWMDEHGLRLDGGGARWEGGSSAGPPF